jgi:arylsulfatase
MPTLLAAAGDPDIKEKLLNGHQVGNKTFKVHLDGYNFMPYFKNDAATPPRVEYFYFSDDGDLMALRYDHWKLVFLEQQVVGTLRIWAEPLVPLRVPKLFNLRTDPYERADITSNTYYDWMINHLYLFIPAQRIVGEFLSTFIAYPPRQKAASFSIDQVMDKLSQHGGGSH